MTEPNGAWEIAAATDRGRERERNEDYFGVFEPETAELERRRGILVVVADGMGGHLSGGRASRTAVEALGDEYFRDDGDAGEKRKKDEEEPSPADRLADAFAAANRAVFDEVGGGRNSVAGTTCTAAILFPDRIVVAHAGDSRAYLLRGGAIEQLTDDHSEVGEMLRKGLIGDDEAMKHPRRNVITKAVGLRGSVAADVSAPLPVELGDVLLVCSDGLTSMIGADEIAAALAAGSVRGACAGLVEAANAAGGEDNITVVVARRR
ncbi:MAG: serine/threonine-protein phosphatase [Candidatus Krumholzibacteriota bacterium]|nr:serine/threonine-protein phosphatase [Candidatus Krumholzibacteriota bacterium]